MSASDVHAELWAAVEDVLDRLHTLLTADELWDGYRDELDAAVADAGRVLGQLHGIQESRTPDGDVKRCPRCDTIKPVDEFGLNRTRCDGLQAWCKPCSREYDRERRAPANTACGDSTSDVASQRAPARRLTAPTGQPVEPDPDSRPPAHAGSPNRTPSTLTPLT